MQIDLKQPQTAPRAIGSLTIASKAGRGGAVSMLDRLHQSGCCRAVFPRGPDDHLDAVILNTAGGLTGGDRLAFQASAGTSSHLVVTTQAAERIYKAQPGQTARVATQIKVADGARLDWLPQETILFDRARLRRRLDADLTGGGAFLACETLVFGRAAMGETITDAHLRDDVRISRDGALIFADAIALAGDMDRHLKRPALGGGAGAVASVVLAAPGAGACLDGLRALLPDTGGASLIREDVLFARILARDSFLLRKTLIPALAQLRGRAIPPTWTI